MQAGVQVGRFYKKAGIRGKHSKVVRKLICISDALEWGTKEGIHQFGGPEARLHRGGEGDEQRLKLNLMVA